MTTEFEQRGEVFRKFLGIEGGSYRAQRVVHPYISDNGYNWCVICGMSYAFVRHEEFNQGRS